VEKSASLPRQLSNHRAVAVAVVLLLQVPAVILSAAKDPEELKSSAEGGSKARSAKRLILLPLFSPSFFFCECSPKIACQAPKPSKPHKQNKIDLAF
jgi:hypothetical protein